MLKISIVTFNYSGADIRFGSTGNFNYMEHWKRHFLSGTYPRTDEISSSPATLQKKSIEELGCEGVGKSARMSPHPHLQLS
jgi:hypothetical protein